MGKKYRVVVCGTGGVGGGVLREALRMPWIEVVGVLVYTPAKSGIDAGELAGMAPIGVRTTMDFNAIVALPADCVMYCALDPGDYSNDEPIIRLLESGKHVITSLAYHYLEMRSEAVVQKFEAACKKGGVAFHANGINPGYVVERLAMLATGLCNDIQHIKVEEFFDCIVLQKFILEFYGIGQPMEEARKLDTALRLADAYIRQSVLYACEQFGVKIDKVTAEQFCFEAPEDIHSIDMLIKKGTLGGVLFRWTAYVDGKPFFVKENNWFMGPVMKPAEGELEHWRISIEGRPSVKLTLDINASNEKKMLMYDDDPTPPGYYATAVPMVQMLPIVCSSAPGVLHAMPVGPHWTKEFGTSRK